MAKVKIMVAIIMVVTLITAVPVFAADHTFSFTVTPETISAKAGETITIDIGVSDIDQSTDGINAIEGEVDFDSEMFENVEIKTTANNWSVNYNPANNGKFVLAILGSEKESKNIAKLTATVKKDTELKTGTITFKDVFSSYQDLTTTEKSTKTVTVNIESSSEEKQEDKDNENIINPSDDKSSRTDSKNTVNPANTQTKQSGTATKTVLPKTGIVSWIGIVVVAITIVAIIELIKYRRLTK